MCEPCVSRFLSTPRRCKRCALALPPLSPQLAAVAQVDQAQATPDLCLACLRHAPELDAALAALPYAYPWSTLIAHYKFGEQPAWAHFFARLMLTRPDIQAALSALTAEDWLLPLPLSPERLQARGFNQAWELASALARQSGTLARLDAGLLLRVRHTRAQSQLGRAARLANVRGAFLADPLRAAELTGRQVLLVDDVMTSGASLFSAAEALHSAGAAHVAAAVLARTQ